MENKLRFFTALVLMVGFSALLMGCSGSKQETPEEVIEKFKSAATEVETGSITGELVARGKSEAIALDIKAKFKGEYDNADIANSKSATNFNISGNVSNGVQNFTGELDLNLKTLASDIYFIFNKLEVNIPEFEQFKPLIIPYTKRWLQLDPALIPKDLFALQENQDYHNQWKGIFKKSDLFRVNKEFGIESVNGHSAYHYGIELNPSGISQYLQAMTQLTAQEDLNPALENLNADFKTIEPILNSVVDGEIWIGTNDYNLYKFSLSLNLSELPDFPEEKGDFSVDLVLTGDGYNKTVKIEVPDNSNLFNPVSLLLSVGAGTGVDPDSNTQNLPLPGEVGDAEIGDINVSETDSSKPKIPSL